MSNLPLLIEPETLLKHIDDKNLLIVDLSRYSVYEQAHVPGAIHLDFKRLIRGEQPAPGKIPSKESLTKVFSELGLTDNRHVIAYDDEGGGWAGRLIWTLECIGHTKYSYLNGGIHAWIADKMPIELNANSARPSNFMVELSAQASAQVDKQFLLEHLSDDNVHIWDARSEEEFLGTKAFAAKSGHIPGAKHFEWTRGMDRSNALKLKPVDILLEELSQAGIPNKQGTVITHCQTHHRSGFTYLLGKILGFKDIRAYDGSWAEWGNDPDTPVSREIEN